MNSLRKRLLLAAALSAAVQAAAVSADTVSTYTGPNNDNWANAANWTNNPVGSFFPNNGNGGAGYQVIIGAPADPNVTVNLNTGITIDALTLDSGSTLNFINNTQLTIGGGTINNDGVITLSSTGNNTNLEFDANAVLNGAGTISLGNSTINRIQGNSDSALTIGLNQLIEGAGQVGTGTLSIINNGTILANLSAGMILQPDTAGFFNNGLLLADAGATMTLRQGSFTNSGVIQANTNSFVRLDQNASIAGGTLATVGTGQIVITGGNSAFLSNITISAGSQVVGENNSTTFMSNTITNNGTFTLAPTGNVTFIKIIGPTEFAGTGTFVMGPANTSFITANNNFDTLTVDSGITIQGGGNIGNGQLTMINNGIITANQTSNGLILQPSLVASLNGYTNNNLLQASNGGTMFLRNGVFTNNGIIKANDTSVVRLDGNVSVNGGTLTTGGSGQIIVSAGNVAFLNNITISSGSNVLGENNSNTDFSGVITNNGTFTLAPTGNITEIRLVGDVEFAGTGTYVMGPAATSYIFGNSNVETLTVDAGITIQGGGNIGNGEMAMINNGIITANQTSNGLILQPSGVASLNGFTNNNLLQASNGATMFLRGSVFNNTNGIIKANDASAVRLDSSVTVNGGTLTTTGSGQIILSASQVASLNNVTLSSGSNFLVENNANIFVSGMLTNNGTFTLAPTGNLTEIRLVGNVEFAGTGTYVLGPLATSYILGNSNTETLTVDSGITIQGGGNIGNGGIALINNGVITANQTSSALILQPNGVASLNGYTNNNLLQASNGATMILRSNVFNNNSIIRANDASVVQLDAAVTIVGGTLTSVGSGQFIAAASNNVSLANVTLSAGSNFNEQNNATVHVSGKLINNGTFTFLASGNTTNISLDSQAVEFAGTGTFNMNTIDPGSSTAAINGGGTLTIDSGITVQGAGTLSGITINNQGLILGNNSSHVMSILPNGAGLNNSGGKVEAANGATITFSGSVITNSGGTLQADAASAIVLTANVTVNGGLLTSLGSGQLIAAASNFVNLNNATITAGSNFTEQNNATVRVGTILTNNGTFTILANGNNTDINLVGQAVEFAGTGTFNMNSLNTGGDTSAIDGGGTLTIDSGITVQGGGSLSGIGIINSGNIIGNNSNAALTIAPSAAGVTNTNNIRATAGGGIVLFGGTYTNTGGTMTADTGSSIHLNSSASIIGGILSSNGTGLIDVNQGIIVSFNNITLATGSLLNVENNSDAHVSGVITNNGQWTVTSTGNLTHLRIDTNTEFAGTGTFTLQNSTTDIIDAAQTGLVLTVDPGVTIQGGGFVGNSSIAGIFNAGTFVANDPTTLFVAVGTAGFSNTGTLIATNGATMNVNALSQDTSSTLTAGTYKAFANSTLLIVNGVDITTNNASVYLSGTGSVFARINPLATNNGDFHILAGRKFIPVGDFANNGLLELGDPTASAGSPTFDMTTHNFTNNASGTITGFGYFNGRPLNHGTIIANGGTLAFSNGVNGGSGTLEAMTGATLDLSSGSSGSNADNLLLQSGGSLSLGANNVLIKVSYSNGDFGIGNTFNKHANVSASTGKILADGNNTQAITGNVTGGTLPAVTMDFGNIHVGATSSFSYQVNNVATSGPSLLFAIQNNANGGHITDPRLSGLGIVSQNTGSTAAGSSSAVLPVIFSGASSGSLTLQALHIANDFDGNTAVASGPGSLVEQTINITGAAWNLASFQEAPTTLNLGNHHVNDIVTAQNYLVANTAPVDGFSEKLDASISGNIGNVSIAGNINLLSAGQTDSSSISASYATAPAGPLNGTAVLTLQSDGQTPGTAGNSGLGLTTLGSITLQATGGIYRLANPLMSNNPVAFGNHHVGDTVTQNIMVTNNVPNDGFSEALDGTLSNPTGANTFDGNFSLRPAGSISVVTANLDTSTAGSKSGSAALTLISNGSGTSNLGTTPISTVTLTSSGNVYRLASPAAIANFNLGVLHVGQTASAPITISNLAAADGFSEKLDAAFTGHTGAAGTSGGPVVALPGGTATGMIITFDTATAQIGRSGTATIHFDSDGAGSSNLGITPLTPDETITVSADVYNFATAALLKDSGSGSFTVQNATTVSLDLGTLAPGANASTFFNVLNTASGPADALSGTWTIAAADFGTSTFTSFNGLAAGSTLGGFDVTFSSLTTGIHTGTITLVPTSVDVNSASASLSPITLTVTADVEAPVPEPASALLLVAAAPLLLRRRRKS